MNGLTRPVIPVPVDTTALIESIYKISLEPSAYDDFMEHWDDHITNAVDALRDLKIRAEQSNSLPYAIEVEKHFEIGFRLLEELGRGSLTGYFLENDEDRASEPKLLIDPKGQIVWFNGKAAQVFGLGRGALLSDLDLDPSAGPALRAMMAGLRSGTLNGLRQTVLRLSGTKTGRPLYMIAKPTQDRNGETLLLVQELTVGWPSGMERLLVDAFRLSHAEIEVAARIADGLSPQDIADERGSSLSTVRTQIKKILSKTGAKGQADLVRLLHAMIRVADADRPMTETVQRSVPKRMIPLRGRRMPVEVLGDPEGAPVIMFHGMLDGCALSRDMHSLLARRNLRLIAPVRPWFGQAEGDTGDVAGAMTRFAHDIAEMCDQMNLRNPVLLGHMAGSLYACACAAHMGDRVAGVVNISGGVPIVSIEQFRAMSRRQRLVAYTARYTPTLLPFILRAGIRQLDFGGEASFAKALYESSPHDLEALKDPEVFDLVRAGYHFTVAQGHRAFETDAYHVVRDWSAMFEQSKVPVHCIHGVGDPVVTIASVREFAARYPDRVTLTELEDAGQLVFFRKPATVVRALETMVETVRGCKQPGHELAYTK